MYVTLKHRSCLPRLLMVIIISYTCLSTFAAQAIDQPRSTPITLKADNVTLAFIFKAIKKQTGRTAFYSSSVLNNSEKVSVNFVNTPLDKVLDFLLEGKPLEWFYNEANDIMIRPAKDQPVRRKEDKKDTASLSTALTGKITDASGNPLPGATVIVKGTQHGVTADNEGKFSLPKVDPDAVLIVSSMGFETREIPVKGKTIMAQLNVVVNDLDEAVIIAYGTTTKRFNTGNVSTVKSEDIEKQPVSNPMAALQGRIPGMLITQQTGVPGGGFNIQIRGQNSIANGNNPLYVIDGVPYTSTLLPSLGSNILGGINSLGNVGSPFNFLNPADIESIDVLKDADATAIYGSRGANGVVLITTKKGKVGKTTIDLNAYSGIGKVTRTIDLLDTRQYLEMRREAFKNDNVIPTAGNAADLLVWDTTRYTDWQKLLIGGTANYTDVQASVSGGNSNTQYTLGGGYHRETTVFLNDFSDQKVSAHFSINNLSLDQRLRILFTGNYVVDNNSLLQNDLTRFINLAPDAPPIYNEDGSLNWANSSWKNPFSLLLQKFHNKTKNLITDAVVSYRLLPGLEVKANFGYTDMQVDQVSTTPLTTFNPSIWPYVQRASSFTENNINSWIIEPQLIYECRLGRGTLNALVGTTIQQNRSQGEILDASGFNSDLLLEDIKSAPTVTVNSSTNTQYKYNALFGRINYNWESKYIVNITGRRDGTSRFGPAKRFANFAAIGGAWIFSKEKMVEKAFRVLSFGKLRASYGTTGNDQVGEYRFMDLFGSTGLPYQGAQGLYVQNLFNPDLAWEETRKLEAGLELGFLKDRILFSSSYYRNRSSNQLVSYILSSVTGFTSVAANLPATVQNTGIELLLNTINIRARDFSWRSSVNLTIPRNKLIEYPGLESSPYALMYEVGQPITITKVYQLIGVDKQTGQYQFADSKGNPTFTPDPLTDRTKIVNPSQQYYGGVQNTINYKGFQLDFLFQLVKQTGVNQLYFQLPGYIGYNQPTSVLSRWQEPGDVTNIQRFNQNFSLYGSYLNARESDQAYSDASFIRLKNVSLSYQIPENWRRRVRLRNLRVYMQGQNLLTITGYKGFDPENQSATSLPPLRVLTAGIQITL